MIAHLTQLHQDVNHAHEVTRSQRLLRSDTFNQISGNYRLSTNPAQPIPRRYPGYIFFKFQKTFLHDKPYNIKMQVKFVMS